MYNTTNITNARNYWEIAYAVNQLSTGYFFTLALVVLFFVILVVFKNSAQWKALMFGDSFVCLFFATLMFANGLIGIIGISMFSIVFFISFVIYWWTD